MIRDDFAGPGGWDEGLRLLGRTDVIGVEFDLAACLTATQAGHRRIVGDVREAHDEFLDGIEGYIASPPCQTFSTAGSGGGRAALAQLRRAVAHVAAGRSPEDAVDGVEGLDERSALVLHPMTVIRDFRPRWVALEQVPGVLPIWDAYAIEMRDMGYHVVVSMVQAEQYGVPQTRKRAVLLAHLDREVGLPIPTHSKYHVRDQYRLDEGVLSWVSVEEALGWDEGSGVRFVASRLSHSADRRVDLPASTITSGHATADRRWVSTNYRGEVEERRVSVREAGVLQTFPADYPWTGPKTSQYMQIANAVPPRLAAALLSVLL